MEKQITINLDLHHKILIGLFLLTYLVAMMIQVRDPKTNVKPSDWVLGFLSSIIGGTLAYFFVAKWANIGMRMGFTILFSLVSYRLIVFIVSEEAQKQFAEGFWKGIINMIRNFISNNSNNDNNGNTPNRNG
jgi:TRAP-type uncharacterized transport system fused permease subunit